MPVSSPRYTWFRHAQPEAKSNVPSQSFSARQISRCCVSGRVATYSGQVVTWDQAVACDTSLADVGALRDFSATAPVQPEKDGR
jgi:hypothetical protein